MRTLYIWRHAKSSWTDPGTADHDRPLNERGERNAPFMARLFKQRGEPLDLLVSSGAKRARDTAMHMARELGLTVQQFIIEDELYHASVPVLMKRIQTLPAHAQRVMLVGHNPGLTELIDHLSGEDIGNLPTCGMARIDIPGDSWQMASRDVGTLAWLDHPKQHPGQG